MPVFKDEERGTYYVKCYYTDYTGSKKQKKKRGFKLQREAKEWERSFLEQQQGQPDMTFEALYKLYIEDMSHRLRETTISGKKYLIETKLLPYFGTLPINEIKATTIRKWQNELTSYRDESGSAYSETYLKSINNQLSAILNYAVKYYDLPGNPCHKAGSMGKKNAEEMKFWTLHEFQLFITAMQNDIEGYTAFNTLYNTGMRIGELMALTPADIDTDAHTIAISKSYQRLNGKDLITEPKTPKSNRCISIPIFLENIIVDYMSKIYGLTADARIFPYNKFRLKRALQRGCKLSGVKQIRLHDLRHSHASLLIELGFSPLLIADRLGHEKVETTLNTYSHLYPHRQSEVALKLQELQL